ncbi:MAG: murein L,D-transpeptidase catalytic domain family protein [Bacteroidales bacterium]|nr:murein L,D-transpeptidase catalytic domain family protein [Bacteroidales bacterium]
MIYIFLISFNLLFNSCCSNTGNTNEIPEISNDLQDKIEDIYKKAELKGVVDFEVFKMAMIGYYQLNQKKKNIITIIDYSKPSTKKRFFVIDIDNNKLLYNCLTAHGKKSGNNYASEFSNMPGSKMSSIGFFITAETYSGKHGYSLKLDGTEKDINDNARKRAIVIHAANYVSKSFIKKHGRLGRSWGCPALPPKLSKNIINTIKNGSVLFIYGNDKNYLIKSEYMKTRYINN